MCGVRGHEVLLGGERSRVRPLEERARGVTVAARAPDSPPLECETGLRDIALRERLGFVGQRSRAVERAAKPLDPCELREHLGAPVGRLLRVELRAESLFRRVEIVEVPERSEAVVHERVAYCARWSST